MFRVPPPDTLCSKDFHVLASRFLEGSRPPAFPSLAVSCVTRDTAQATPSWAGKTACSMANRTTHLTARMNPNKKKQVTELASKRQEWTRFNLCDRNVRLTKGP